MMRRVTCAIAGFAALIACAFGAADGTGGATRNWNDDLAQRVAALKPEAPLTYLELAEEIADRAPRDARGDENRALALRLAGQAGALDVPGLGRSAALFIADVSRDPAQRSRMQALADSLGGVEPAAVRRAETSAVLGLAQAFSQYRRGNGAKARAAIEIKGAAALLDAHPEILTGGSARFRADCAAIRDGVPPVMTTAQLDALYALVAAALAPAPRTWSESFSLYGRAPIPDFDLGDPAALFGVELPKR